MAGGVAGRFRVKAVIRVVWTEMVGTAGGSGTLACVDPAWLSSGYIECQEVDRKIRTTVCTIGVSLP